MSWIRKIYNTLLLNTDDMFIITALTCCVTATLKGRAFTAQGDITIPSGQSVYVLGINSATGDDNTLMYDRIVTIKCAEDKAIDCTLQLFQDCEYSAAGTPIAIHNKNHNMDLTDNLFDIYTGPTITNEGTALTTSYFMADAYEIVSVPIIDKGYIMKQETPYLIKITNNGLKSIQVLIDWLWSKPIY